MMLYALWSWLLLQRASMPTGPEETTEPALSNWFVIYIVVMTTAAVLGILLLILLLSFKLSRISKQLNDISDSAAALSTCSWIGVEVWALKALIWRKREVS